MQFVYTFGDKRQPDIVNFVLLLQKCTLTIIILFEGNGRKKHKVFEQFFYALPLKNAP